MNLLTFISGNSVLLVAILTPIIIGLVQVVKNFVPDTKWSPVFSVAFGILLGYFFGGYDNVSFNILLGVIAGLTACGLYAGTKKVTE